MPQNGFVRVYAAPGIDSPTTDQGILSSGAGAHPSSLPKLSARNASPVDWANESAAQGGATEHLVAGYAATKSPNANSLKVRVRGISPWGSKFVSSVKVKQAPGRPGAPDSSQHPQGNADLNPGAGSMIAGGRGAASTFVRTKIRDPKNRQGMKLPVLPGQAQRGGAIPIPSGGGVLGTGPAAPVTPLIPGLNSIFKFMGAK